MLAFSASQLVFFGIGILLAFVVATAAGHVIVRAGFPTPSTERIGCVDGLRGYLALSVMVHHFAAWMQVTRLGGHWAPLTSNVLSSMGTGAVALFFMVTGLVFYPRIRAGFKKTAWLATYIGRAFRIFPLIAFSVAVIMVIIAGRITPHWDAGMPLALAKWLTSWSEPPLLGYPDSGRLNAYVFWTLHYEWMFYFLVLPISALVADLLWARAPSVVLPAALLVLSLAARLVIEPVNPPQTGEGVLVALRYLLHGQPTYLPCFAIGMLSYEVRRSPRLCAWLMHPGVSALVVAGLVVGMCISPEPYGVSLPLYGAFFICVACGNSLGGVLRHKGALMLGECSYGIYLLHGVVLSLLFVEGARLTNAFGSDFLPLLLPVAGLAITCVTALTFLGIERPGIWLGSVVAKRVTSLTSARTRPTVSFIPR